MRKDGERTRMRILEAACQVFSEKGYAGATVAEICRRAGVNVAAVNYYFGDKENLYIEVWRYAFSKHPWPRYPDPNDPPEKQLRDYIHSMVGHFMSQGPHGTFVRLYMMELLNPTGRIQDLWGELIKPRRDILLGIIRRIMGKSSVDEDVILCELSIVNQCRVLATVRRSDLEKIVGRKMDHEFLERLTDHITRFSLAGIRAVGSR